MSDGYKADLTKIKAVATEFLSVKGQLDGLFRELLGRMNATKDNFQSVAGDEFRQLMQAYNQDAENLDKALQKIAEMLNTQAGQYDQVQQKTQQVVAEFKQSIAGKLQAN